MARSKTKRPSTDAAREVGWARAVHHGWKQTRPELTDDKYVHELGLQPDDPLFAKLAKLAQVSAADIERLKRGVSYELHLFSIAPSKSPVSVRVGSNKRALAYGYWRAALGYEQPRTSSNKRALTQLRGLAKLFGQLSAIVSNLDILASNALVFVDSNREYMERNRGRSRDDGPPNPPNPGPEFANWSKAEWFKIIPELAELSSDALTLLQGRGPLSGVFWMPPRPQGRPRHGPFSQISSQNLTEFTLRLLLEVRAAGGRLTLDKNTGTGTLVDALTLLRPHRPGLIPKKLPMSTLARVKTLDQKIASDPRSTENIWS
jgi:hypothetical protein